MYKHDVIHESGSTKHIATLPEEDRATSIGNKKVGEVWTYSSALPEVRVRTCRQTGPTRKHTSSSISNVVRKLGAPCIKTDCSSWTISATTTITKHSRSYPRPYLPLRSSWRRHRSCEAAFQSSFSPWIPPTRRATCCHCTTRPLRNCWTCEHAALSSPSVVQPRRAHRRLV